MFYTGQKVVCIDARGTNSANVPELVEQQIYTVLWCGELPNTLFNWLYRLGLVWHSPCYLRLHEIRRPFIAEVAQELPFCAARFRPVVTRRTDISIFTEMLDRTRELV